MLIHLANVFQKWLHVETEFLIDICGPNGDKWQSKTLFQAIFDRRSSIVQSVSSGVTLVLLNTLILYLHLHFPKQVLNEPLVFCNR